MYLKSCKYAVMALLVVGSASLLFSCDTKPEATVYDYETLKTESSENRTITMMENGKRSYTFVSPLMEGYSLASNPYQEFRRGIRMTTYTDSLSLVDATITANYAIYYERQKLWEAKGNVVIIKKNRKAGDTVVTGLTEIYTQQLFWNATTKKIYSNVDTKVLQPDGWHFGVGFDADDDLKNIHFRKYSSEMEFDMSQPEPSEKDKEKDEKSEEAKKTKEDNADKDKSADKGANRPSNNRPTDNKAKRPAVQSPADRNKDLKDRNLSPMPGARPERPGVKSPVEQSNLPATPVAPSMGRHQEGVPVGNMEVQTLSAGAMSRSGAKAGAANGIKKSDDKR